MLLDKFLDNFELEIIFFDPPFLRSAPQVSRVVPLS